MRISNRGWEAASLGALEMFFFNHAMKNTWSTIRFGDEEVKQVWEEAYTEFLESTLKNQEKFDSLLEWYSEKEWEESVEQRDKDETDS